MIQKSGLVLKMGSTLIQSPFVGIAHKSIEQMRYLMAEFDMTPSSRTRIAAPKPNLDNDPNFGTHPIQGAHDPS
jgi:hypothetical protein